MVGGGVMVWGGESRGVEGVGWDLAGLSLPWRVRFLCWGLLAGLRGAAWAASQMHPPGCRFAFVSPLERGCSRACAFRLCVLILDGHPRYVTSPPLPLPYSSWTPTTPLVHCLLPPYPPPHRNVGSMDKGDANVGTGLVGAPACGDVMKLQIRVDPATGKITESVFKTFGCGSAIASSSLATEWIKGKGLAEAGGIKNRDIAKELRLPPVKLHCSMLAEDAIRAAIKDVKSKQAAAAETVKVAAA